MASRQSAWTSLLSYRSVRAVPSRTTHGSGSSGASSAARWHRPTTSRASSRCPSRSPRVSWVQEWNTSASGASGSRSSQAAAIRVPAVASARTDIRWERLSQSSPVSSSSSAIRVASDALPFLLNFPRTRESWSSPREREMRGRLLVRVLKRGMPED